MSLIGFVCSVASATVAAVGSAISTIGPAVSSFCTNVLPRLAPFIEKGLEALQVVGKIAQALLQIVGIFKPKEDIQDMGDRAMQAAEKGTRPENFDKFDDYLESIRNMELDPEKSQKSTAEQKIAAGLAIGAKGLEEKFNAPEGSMGNLWVLAAAAPAFFNEHRLESIIKSTTDIATVMRYFDGKLDLSEARSMGKTLVDAERTLSPGKIEEAIRTELRDAQEAVRNLSA